MRVESLGAAARRLLEKLDRDAQAMDKATRSLETPGEIEPAAKGQEEGAPQAAGIRAGRRQRGLERGGQTDFQVSRSLGVSKSFSLGVIADVTDCPDAGEIVGGDRAGSKSPATPRVIRFVPRSGGCPRPPIAPTGVVIAFPVGAFQRKCG